MTFVLIILAVVVIAVLYFAFQKKAAGPAERKPAGELREPPSSQPMSSRAPPPPRRDSGPVGRAPTAAAAAAEVKEIEEDILIQEAPAVIETRPSLVHVRDIESLRRGLEKSRKAEGFFGRLVALLGGKKEIGKEIAAQIEEVLLSSDVGVQTTQTMLTRINEMLSRADLVDSGRVWDALRTEARRILRVDEEAGAFQLRGRPTVVLLVGVNGSGKTTTIGKLATKLRQQGHRCVLAAGDTFRAAAVQQLAVWGERVGCDVVRGKDGADPGSVIFDAIKKAQEVEADLVLADTAGRLHTKTNLMAEMEKVVRIAGKALPGAPHEVLLVIDATNGQNALAQAREFKEALPLTGIVLTKLDGTAKGGIILGICDTLRLPVRFVGLGERPDDLYDFSPDEFVDALLGKDTEASAA